MGNKMKCVGVREQEGRLMEEIGRKNKHINLEKINGSKAMNRSKGNEVR